MSLCEYINEVGRQCSEKAFTRGDGLCILHNQEKQLNQFRKLFWRYVTRCESDEKLNEIQCDGFIVPEGFILDRVPKKCLEFNNSVFLGDFYLLNLNFVFGPFFEGCEFKNNFTMHNVQTGGDFLLRNTIVNGSFELDWSDIKGIARISNCTFKRDARFNRIKISESMSLEFNMNSFNDSVLFTKCVFKGSFVLEEPTLTASALILFEDVNLSTSESFRITKTRIAKLKFINTNLEKVDLVNCKWSRRDRRIISGDEERKKISQMSDSELLVCAHNYRMLKHNFDKRSETDLASDMYIGEMEARREMHSRKTKTTLIRFLRKHFFSGIALYRHISLYGERWGRPALLYIALIFGSPFLHLLNGFSNGIYNVNYDFDLKGFSTVIQNTFLKDYGQALRISLQAATLQRTSSYTLSGLGPELFIFHFTLSAALITLFLLALRRKFVRRRDDSDINN